MLIDGDAQDAVGALVALAADAAVVVDATVVVDAVDTAVELSVAAGIENSEETEEPADLGHNLSIDHS